MTLVLNIVWIIFGGAVMALGWVFAALLMACSIVGLPWVPAALRLAAYTLLPFGSTVVERDAGTVSLIGNIVWLVLAGWWLALAHVLVALCFGLTIIGMPFAWAHLKLAMLSLTPVGKQVVALPR
ncbi:MAG TPA: YccF domain-containing protein [Patescibacteria group bacterium]|nr:YccF domain-containing protein [Patescibacteria group bacterium]